jgi:Flp pilus assembly protein TadB
VSRALGIGVALATLFLLFGKLHGLAGILAAARVLVGWTTLFVLLARERRDRRLREESRLAAALELWSAAAVARARADAEAATASPPT